MINVSGVGVYLEGGFVCGLGCVCYYIHVVPTIFMNGKRGQVLNKNNTFIWHLYFAGDS